MKAKQRELLTNLSKALQELDEELQKDHSFHDYIAEESFKMNTFHKSIDELALDISLMKKNL